MLKIAFELTINLIETFLMLDFITRYFEGDYKNKKTLTAFIITWLITFFELSIINSISVMEGIAVFIPIAIYFIYSLLFLKGNIWLKLWISCLIEILVMLIAIGTNLVVCSLIGYDPHDMITVFNAVRIISVIITKIILFYITRIILKVRYKNPIDKNLWLMLIFVPVISIFSLSALMIAAINHDELTVYILTGMSGILFADGITYYFFVYVNKEYESRMKLEVFEQQLKYQSKYMDEIMASQKQVRKIRHDMKNHNIALLSYFENQDYSSGIEYIKKISSEAGKNEKLISTGNTAFDVILNTKKSIAESKGTELETILQIPEKLFVDSVDICIIFGNALDNAIEACEKIKNGEKKISVSVVYEDNSLICKIENTALNENNPDLKTTKKDKKNHGYGIENIKSALSKYKNVLNIEREENKFILSFIIWEN